MRAHELSGVALALALGGFAAIGPGPFAPVALAAPLVEPEARYEAETFTLTLVPPPGVVPTITEGRNPVRIIAEWPGNWNTAPRGILYGAGPVYRFLVEAIGERTRVTLFFRNELEAGYTVGVINGKTIVRISRGDSPFAYVPPLPKRTPRPAPPIAYRVTPAPVFPVAPTARPLPGWAQPRPLPPVPNPAWRHNVPAPFPYAGQPSAAPWTPAPTPVPVTPAPATPAPTPVPLPVATPTPPPLPAMAERPVFGSQLYFGGEPGVMMSERYPQGGVDASIPWTLGGGFGWDHMFSESVGLAIAGRTQGYVLDDDAVRARGFEAKHKRDEYELTAGIRGRMAFGGGLEGMLQPGLLTRYVSASTTHAKLTGGVPGDAVPVDTTDYLSSSWLGIGPAVRAGLGWRLGGPFALATYGDFRYVATGSVLTQGVDAFFPMMGWRAGGEARLDLDGFGLALGYVMGHDGHAGTGAADTLDQDGGTAYGRASWLY